MLDSIIGKDIELLIYLNNLGTVQWDGFWLFITNKYSSIPLYLLLLYFTFKHLGIKKTILVVLFVILLISFSDQTSNLFKNGFERLRPCLDDNISPLIRAVKSRCTGKYAYFSAHASNSMAVAIFFGLILKNRFKYLFQILVIWAIFVGYSRIYIGYHYPLDVITGFFIGGLYAYLLYKIQNFIFVKYLN